MRRPPLEMAEFPGGFPPLHSQHLSTAAGCTAGPQVEPLSEEQQGGEGVSPQHCCVHPVPPCSPFPPYPPSPIRAGAAAALQSALKQRNRAKLKQTRKAHRCRLLPKGSGSSSLEEGLRRGVGCGRSSREPSLGRATRNGCVVTGALRAPGGLKTCRCSATARRSEGWGGHLCPLSRSAVPKHRGRGRGGTAAPLHVGRCKSRITSVPTAPCKPQRSGSAPGCHCGTAAAIRWASIRARRPAL